MNEITRIHLAKTAYDIEIAAKKQLEKYIKSLEAYTQDEEVLTDIEIRITEILAERGVAAGGVVGSEDVVAVRKQLGEPHEFAAEGDGDIAVGPATEAGSRRLYRSTDNAVLGGVLSGVAGYFNVNPLWTRLVFVLLLFISFGFAAFAYILAWIIIPPARTATEKLQLAGKDVTLESIKELNASEEAAQPNRVAPALQRVFSVIFGGFAALASLGVIIVVIWAVASALTNNAMFMDATNGFIGLGGEYVWLVWLLFWIVVFGASLLAGLFGLIAYAFLARKLTKRMILSGVIVIVLGIASVATVIGVGSTQSARVANETRSLMRETRANLPREFANVTSATLKIKPTKVSKDGNYFVQYPAVRYIVDDGAPRYELEALPTTKAVITTEGTAAVIEMEIPSGYRNAFVQPILTVYGPALTALAIDNENNSAQLSYSGASQDSFTINPGESGSVAVSGTYEKVIVKGSGSVQLDSATVKTLEVNSEQNLMVTAGTVRELTVTQPDVCPSGTYQDSTRVEVENVTSGTITYNGTARPAADYETSCASVEVNSDDEDEFRGY